MKTGIRRTGLAANAAIPLVVAILSSCGENPYAPPPITKRAVAATPASSVTPTFRIDDVADLKDCAGAVQALLGFDPIVQSDRDDAQLLPVYYRVLGLLEKQGVDFSQRIEATRANAGIWLARARPDQEARVRQCQARYPG